MEKKKNYTLNLALIGDSQVGKTTFKNRLLGQHFDNDYISTIGIICDSFEFYNKSDNSKVIIKIWDTAGQEVFRSTCSGVIKKSDIIIFIRDNIHDGLDNWLNFLEENTDIESENIKMVFCLNKTDLIKKEEEKNEIKEILLNKAQKYQNTSVLCFSLTNDNDVENIKLQIQTFALNLINKGIKALKDVFNICLIGPSMVGKTSLIERIINDDFIESTILTDKMQKNSCHVDLKNNCDVKYNYYDIPGQEKYMKEELNVKILKSIDIIIFVNDNKEKAISTKILKQKIRNLKEKNIIFCVNKSDLIAKKDNFKKEYKKINKDILGSAEPILVSALNKEGIDTLKEKINDFVDKKFGLISDDEKLTSVTRPLHGVINLEVNQTPEKTKCC